jgi:hypothetical protein
MNARTISSGVLLLLAGFAFSLPADETSVPQQPLRSNPPAVFALTGAQVVLQADAAPEPAVKFRSKVARSTLDLSTRIPKPS